MYRCAEGMQECCAGRCATSPLDGDNICCDFGEKRTAGGREGGGEICVWGTSETCCDGKCCGEVGTQQCCAVTAECCGQSGLCCDGNSQHCCNSEGSGLCCPTDACCGGSCCAPPNTCCPDNTCKLSSCNLGGATVAVCRGSSADFDISFTCTDPCRTDEAVSISPAIELPANGIQSVTFGAGDCLSRTAVGIVTVAADAPFGAQQVPLHMCGLGDAECTGELTVTVAGPDIAFPGVAEAKEVNTGGFLVLNDINSDGNLVDVTLTINGDLTGATVRLQHGLGRGKIKVYEGATQITAWPHTWAPGTFSSPTTVKVEGVQVSSLREVGMTLRYEPAGGGFCTDQIKMTVVRPDIAFTDLPEAKEVNTGGFLPLNNDDDDTNGLPDLEQGQPVANDDDFRYITLWVYPYEPLATVELTTDPGNTKCHRARQNRPLMGASEPASGQHNAHFSCSWQAGLSAAVLGVAARFFRR